MVKSATTIAERLKELAESKHDIKVSSLSLSLSVYVCVCVMLLKYLENLKLSHSILFTDFCEYRMMEFPRLIALSCALMSY